MPDAKLHACLNLFWPQAFRTPKEHNRGAHSAFEDFNLATLMFGHINKMLMELAIAMHFGRILQVTHPASAHPGRLGRREHPTIDWVGKLGSFSLGPALYRPTGSISLETSALHSNFVKTWKVMDTILHSCEPRKFGGPAIASE